MEYTSKTNNKNDGRTADSSKKEMTRTFHHGTLVLLIQVKIVMVNGLMQT